MKKNSTILVTALLLVIAVNVSAQRPLLKAVVGNGNGGWNQIITWVTATGENRAPMDGDSIVIPANVTVRIGYTPSTLIRDLTNVTIDIFGTLVLVQPPADNMHADPVNELHIHTPTNNPNVPVIRVAPTGTISTETVAGGGVGKIVVIVNNDPTQAQTKYSTENVANVPQGEQAIGTINGPATAFNTFGVTPTYFLLGINSSLPVLISSFAATENGNTVVLHWTSQQEVNFKTFIIERSDNGSNNWQQISTMQASGQSTTAANYKYEDNTASAVNYYRLGMVDVSGAIAYSKILIVRLKKSGTNVTLYPNPAVNSANISIENSLAQQGFTLNLLNQNGQMVIQKKPAKGTTLLSLDLSAYKAGIYTIDILFGNGTRETQKLVVTK